KTSPRTRGGQAPAFPGDLAAVPAPCRPHPGGAATRAGRPRRRSPSLPPLMPVAPWDGSRVGAAPDERPYARPHLSLSEYLAGRASCRASILPGEHLAWRASCRASILPGEYLARLDE